MATIAFVLHHQRPEAVELVRDATKWLVERGHEVRLGTADAGHAGLGEHGCNDEELLHDLGLVISLGGDGTMLRAVDLVADRSVPVLGINLGQLGYLTEVEPSGLRMALKRYLAGSYDIERRMRLAVTLDAPSGAGPASGTFPALNEAVVGKTPAGQVVRLRATIDGELLTTYYADGIIVATPTGSTAYAWSAGGPIMAPTHEALLLTPVAPHTIFDRSLVLDPNSIIRLEVVGDRAATLSVDGINLGQLEAGDAVVCTASKKDALLVTFGPRNFINILKSKFGLDEGSGK